MKGAKGGSKDGIGLAVLINGVNVMVPVAVGVILNVWGEVELLKVRVIGVRPALPEPVMLMVVVPVKDRFGVMVKLEDAPFTLPLEGPLKVKVGMVQAVVVAAATSAREDH